VLAALADALGSDLGFHACEARAELDELDIWEGERSGRGACGWRAGRA
jgi:hypothetical protein